MSGIIKNVLKLSLLKSTNNVLRTSNNNQLVRNMWHMSCKTNLAPGTYGLHQKENSTCGCGIRRMHSRGDGLRSKAVLPKIAEISPGEKELADFLNEEILSEKKLQKTSSIPSELNGFIVTSDGAEITLTKEAAGEVVEVNFNVNFSVNMDVEADDVDPSVDKPADINEMKSRPTFEIEIKRGDKTLGFTCSIATPTATSHQQQETGYNDLFSIDEVVMYEGEWKESDYSVSGEVIDGTFYDLLMNLLEDKGIGNDFVEKLTELSTNYEHKKYISLLENVQKFVTQK